MLKFWNHTGLQPTDVVLDLFCGTGTITLSLAQHCQTVIGIESSADAVADAKHNAALNGITNATFWQANLASVAAIASVAAQLPAIDVVVAGGAVLPFPCAGSLPHALISLFANSPMLHGLLHEQIMPCES